MLMNYSFHANLETSEETTNFEFVSSPSKNDFPVGKTDNMRLVSDKIRMPNDELHIVRPRLCEILSKFSEQFGATLVTGRAGTGKTTLAIDFAKQYERVAWFRTDASDMDWHTFSRYFLASFKEDALSFIEEIPSEDTIEENVQQFLGILFSELESLSSDRQFLIVLDDLHCVFDADWFEMFFKSLLAYNCPNIRILMLSRTKPPFPIWRLRSKQKLSVLDEQLLWFTLEETEQFLAKYRTAHHKACLVHKASYGRISKVIELAELLQTHNSAG